MHQEATLWTYVGGQLSLSSAFLWVITQLASWSLSWRGSQGIRNCKKSSSSAHLMNCTYCTLMVLLWQIYILVQQWLPPECPVETEVGTASCSIPYFPEALVLLWGQSPTFIPVAKRTLHLIVWGHLEQQHRYINSLESNRGILHWDFIHLCTAVYYVCTHIALFCRSLMRTDLTLHLLVCCIRTNQSWGMSLDKFIH